jgi:predicted DNA-binding protein
MNLPPALVTRLRIAALREGRTMTAIVTELVEGYLAKVGG